MRAPLGEGEFRDGGRSSSDYQGDGRKAGSEIVDGDLLRHTLIQEGKIAWEKTVDFGAIFVGNNGRHLNNPGLHPKRPVLRCNGEAAEQKGGTAVRIATTLCDLRSSDNCESSATVGPGSHSDDMI